MMGVVDLQHLEIVHMYLFGGVKFLHLLLLLMLLDIITGLFKGWKNKNLWSRKSLFGYARKLLVLVMIILANVIDQVLNLGGTLTFATVLFYLANEGLSIVENMAELEVLVPTKLADKLKVIGEEKQSSPDEFREELTGNKVDKELEKVKKEKQ